MLKKEYFTVSFRRLNDKDIKISIDNSFSYGNLEYAYYVLKDGKVVHKQWYEEKNEYFFTADQPGRYSIQYFIKSDRSDTLIDTTDTIIIDEEHSFKEVFLFNIHGSCVTRDIFNFIKEEPLKLGVYIARQSIISSVSSPMKVELEDIKLKSSFQARILYMDLTKKIFEELSNNKSDYYIMDLIDERFSLVKIKDSIFTYSNELNSSGLLENLEFETLSKFRIDEKVWKDAIDRYVEEILKIYQQEQIIIHEAYYVDEYYNKEGSRCKFTDLITNKSIVLNKMLESYYRYLKERLPHAHILNFDRSFLASEKHIWGLEPIHYEDNYYINLLKQLQSIALNVLKK